MNRSFPTRSFASAVGVRNSYPALTSVGVVTEHELVSLGGRKLNFGRVSADVGTMRWRSIPSAWFVGGILVAEALGFAEAWSANRNGVVFRAPAILFFVVLVAASGCVVTSLAVLRLARRDNRSELGFLSSFFFAVSMFPLVHGLTTPGVLYGPNAATMATAFWAVPLATVCGLPQIFRSGRVGRALHARWRTVVCAQMVVTVTLSVSFLRWPNLVSPPSPSWFSRTLCFTCFSLCVVFSFRHIGLARVAQKSGPLWVAFGYISVGSSVFVYPSAMPYSFGFWLAHVLDIVGVFAATVVAWRCYRSPGSAVQMLRAITICDPLMALEYGLDDVVRSFVADIDRKDEITRDHVIRTAELAIHVGAELALPADRLRTLGLGALLHDLGKISVPDAILNKPGRLTDDEVAVMRGHAEIGARMVEQSAVLVGVAAIVRSHHERVDGRGYPQGLIGAAIPIEARIVSACDAFDAMANSRQYRDGMGLTMAISVLREHQGSQWDSAVVDALVRVLGDSKVVPPTTALTNVGREENGALPSLVLLGPCGCVDPELVTV